MVPILNDLAFIRPPQSYRDPHPFDPGDPPDIPPSGLSEGSVLGSNAPLGPLLEEDVRTEGTRQGEERREGN